MSFDKKIRLIKTFGEFEYLDSIAQEMNFEDFKSYLSSSMRKLSYRFNECHDCITPAYGDKVRKEYYIPNKETYDSILQISILRDTSMAAVIDDILVSPLLLPQLKDKDKKILLIRKQLL